MRSSQRERGKVWEGTHRKPLAVLSPGGSVQLPSPALTYNNAPEYSQVGKVTQPQCPESSLSPDQPVCTTDFSLKPS